MNNALAMITVIHTTHTGMYIHSYTHRYTSSGAESALQRCVEHLGELQRQSGERGQERKELEERIKALQKQLANAKVSSMFAL